MSQLASNTHWQQDWNFHNQPGLLTHLWLNLAKLKLMENTITKHRNQDILLLLMLVPSTLVFLEHDFFWVRNKFNQLSVPGTKNGS